MPAFRPHRKSVRVLAAAAATLLNAGHSTTATASIITTGVVSPSPITANVDSTVDVGSSAVGSLAVNGGSALTAKSIVAGGGATGSGTVNISGAGTRVTLSGPATTTEVFNPLALGNWGTGTMTVSGGATVDVALSNPNCISSNCNVFVGNGAGSTGSLTLTGADTAMTVGPTGFIVAGPGVFTQQSSGFTFGTPGGTTTGTVNVLAGATLETSNGAIANGPGGAAPTGTERSFGNVIVDGLNSVWTIVRERGTAGARTLLGMATGANSTGSLDIRNGGKVTLFGSLVSGQPSNAYIATGGATSTATIRVDGAGSRLEWTGASNGQFGIGYNFTPAATGGTGNLIVSNGGTVGGNGANALMFATVGGFGATGNLTVSGADAAGNASLFRLAGAASPGLSFAGNASFLHVGREGGNGTVSVTGGGRIEIDARQSGGQTTSPGFQVAAGANSVGSFTISGRNATTGEASSVMIYGDDLNPFVAVGRAGGTGTLTISGGGKLEMNGNGPSTQAISNRTSLFIGLVPTGTPATPSTGVLNITGAGSTVALTGSGDRQVYAGFGNGANGTINVANGGSISSTSMFVGDTGAIGALNMSGGASISLAGQQSGGGTFPAVLAFGRGGGTGTGVMTGGATVTVNPTVANGGVYLGGTGPNPGGNGTLTMSGGSTININGPSSILGVGFIADGATGGIGNMTMTGAGTAVNALGANSRVLVGNGVNTAGTLNIGAGATVTAGSFVGVAHNATTSTAGSGVLTVNGTVIAPDIIIGTNGVMKGTGTVVGAVTNFGTVLPGNSPGTLKIDGSFTNGPGGNLVLEVQKQAGGAWTFDQLLLTHASTLLMTGGKITFNFLDDTDPSDFQNAGLFNLDTFFRGLDENGQERALSAILGPTAFGTAFGGAIFDATSDRFGITNFSFSIAEGARFAVAPIPEPSTWALMIAGFALLLFTARRRAAPATRTARSC